MAVKTLGSGLSTNSNEGLLFQDRRQFYLAPQVVKELWSDITPFTTIMSNRSIITGLQDPLFKQFEHRDPWVKQQCRINGTPGECPANDTGLGSISVDGINGMAATPDSSWKGMTAEVWDSTLTTKRGTVVITAVSADPYLTVKNLSGTAFTFGDNDYLFFNGHVSGEGSVAPDAWADELKLVWGSTQELETAIEITGILYQAALRGYSSELARLRTIKAKEHKILIEKTLLTGMSLIGTGLADSRDGTAVESFKDAFRTDADGKALRTTMGLITAIDKYGTSTGDDQNLFTITEGSYKYSQFVDDMEKVFHYVPDSGMKYALCAPGALSYWSKLDSTAGFVGKSGWQVKIGDMQRDSLGFNIRVLQTPHGNIALVPTFALGTPYNKRMIVISDENLSLVQYVAPTFKANIKTDNGYKGEKDVYYSDIGCGMTLIESHKSFEIK